jgi:hypothetical protein
MVSSKELDSFNNPNILLETCEIIYGKTLNPVNGRYDLAFYAKAKGPAGIYVAGQSPFTTIEQPLEERSDVLKMLCQNLVSNLINDHCEPLLKTQGVHGTYWWSSQFRRQVPNDWHLWEESQIWFNSTSNLWPIFGKVLFELFTFGRSSSKIGPTFLERTEAVKGKSNIYSEEKISPIIGAILSDFKEKLINEGWQTTNLKIPFWWSLHFHRQKGI